MVRRATQHLDRCLTCRACETTCPSGVAYGELAEIARNQIGPKRRGLVGLLRNSLAWMVPEVARLRTMSRLGRVFKWALPERLSKLIPAQVGLSISIEDAQHTATSAAKVLILHGCAQQVATPNTNRALQALLKNLDIPTQELPNEGCCGSLDLHAGDEQQAHTRIKANIDRIYPLLPGLRSIVSSASGCGLTIKEWGRILQHDPVYRDRAAEISALVQDASELLGSLDASFSKARTEQRVAWHAPCTLQHGLKINGLVERMLTAAGYDLVRVDEPHLCCGSAGSYSALQPRLSSALAQRKLQGLQVDDPELIATANVGCQSHLAHYGALPVVHWIELLKA